MSICPLDLLDWAKKTYENNSQCEVTLRACASRSYYSCLHEAAEAFEIEVDINQPSSHKAVIDELVIRSKRPGQGRNQAGNLAKLLTKIKRVRVKADYSLDEDFTTQDIERSLESSNEAFESCAEFLRLQNQSFSTG